MRPVAKGMCRLESLLDGSLDFEHIALANDYLDAQDENERLAQEAYEAKRQ